MELAAPGVRHSRFPANLSMTDPTVPQRPWVRLCISRALLLCIYVLISGPLYGGHSAGRAAEFFEPLEVLRQATPCHSPLAWYWGLWSEFPGPR